MSQTTRHSRLPPNEEGGVIVPGGGGSGRLVCFFAGRHFRLTDVHGHVVSDIMA